MLGRPTPESQWRPQMIALHRVLPLAALLGAILAGPVPADATDARRADKVFVQCAVVQGNGYNWAATLGWLSGQVEIAAVRAAAFEAAHPGRRAAIDVGCLTGSSSGGVVAVVLDRLLTNRAVAGGGRDDLLTVPEAREVSKALMFIALSTNFDGEFGRLAMAGIGSYLGFADLDSNSLGGHYWRAMSTVSVNASIFGKWVLAAELYHPEWFDEAVGGNLSTLPLYPTRPATLGLGEDDPTARTMARIAARARGIIDENVAGSDLRDIPVGDGVCVSGLVVQAEPRPPFDYDDLRLVVICNRATYERLSRNRQLGSWLATTHRMAGKLVLANAESWRVMLNVTLREPDLTTPLSGLLTEVPIGLDGVRVLAGAGKSGSVAVGPVVVLGGFADPRLQAWPAAALLVDRLARFRAEGVDADGRLAVFGRTEDRTDPGASFAQTTMVKYFAGGVTALDRYYLWQDEFCEVSDELGSRIPVDFYRMDWNLPGQPGAISDRSQILAAKGYNLGKIQTQAGEYPALGHDFFYNFMFDPTDLTRYLPDPPVGGMRCLPGPG